MRQDASASRQRPGVENRPFPCTGRPSPSAQRLGLSGYVALNATHLVPIGENLFRCPGDYVTNETVPRGRVTRDVAFRAGRPARWHAGDTSQPADGSGKRAVPAAAEAPYRFRRFRVTAVRNRVQAAFRQLRLSQSVVTVDAGVLLVLTVNTSRHPGAYRAALGSDYGYGGGALVGMGARADREREGRRRRDGQAKMYFLPVELQDQSIVVALPGEGRSTPMAAMGTGPSPRSRHLPGGAAGRVTGRQAHGFKIVPWRLPGSLWPDPKVAVALGNTIRAMTCVSCSNAGW